MKPPPCVVNKWQRDSKTAKVPLLSPGRNYLVNKNVILFFAHLINTIIFYGTNRPLLYLLHTELRPLLPVGDFVPSKNLFEHYYKQYVPYIQTV